MQKLRPTHNKGYPIHRMVNSPSYLSWKAMIERCYSPQCNRYRTHGARGIMVCSRWRNAFTLFYADMGERPKGLTLERKDNNGNYEPDNCEWATPTQQARNTRRNVSLTIFGEAKLLVEWFNDPRICCKPKTFYYRIKYGGWTPERAFVTPTIKPLAASLA